ncbi:KH domain-containing, RNA-binding, signal transduction-associated protein 2 [Drosophila sechellia]|uniref:GM15865 n=1 Tax=Drosophila sechellia TaxID=7238 RepID=B4I7V9_DROSE|nr:KH domain-containing, RNA-binding, signal transduction-associated protein 2 [Drosophila sechellia]EDW56684.1 GM15865 [Drosophila sechellia]
MKKMENPSEITEEQPPTTHDYQPRLNKVAQKFLADLDEERQRLSAEFPLCALLIDEARDHVYGTGRIPGKELYADVYHQKPMKIIQKVFVPVKQYPKFNFAGKILGPKGNSLRRLQEETQCKIVLKGRSSMRDRNKEEELRSDPRYAHLHKNLFLEVSTVAIPVECYTRMAYALSEIRKYLIPDKNDEVSHEQLRELMEMDPESAKNFKGLNLEAYRSFSDNSNLIKPVVENPPEVADMDDLDYDYDEHRMPPIHLPMGYEYSIPRPSLIVPKFKRSYPYSTDMKHVPEPPIKSYKPNPGIDTYGMKSILGAQ